MAQNNKKVLPLFLAAALGAVGAFIIPSQPADGGRRRAEISDRDPYLYKGDWGKLTDGGFRFTAFGHAFDVDGKPIKLIEVDSVACESSSWSNGLSACLREFKKQNGLP